MLRKKIEEQNERRENGEKNFHFLGRIDKQLDQALVCEALSIFICTKAR